MTPSITIRKPSLYSAILIALGAATRLYLLSKREWISTIDDCYITVRVAEKFLSGHGFVFNDNERVLAITTPLWGLLIAAASLVLRPMAAVMILSFLCYGVTAFLLDRLLARCAGTTYRLLAVAMYALYYPFVSNTVSGMETSFFLALLLASFYMLPRQRRLAFLLGGLSVLARPEGILVLLIMGALTLWQNRVPKTSWLTLCRTTASDALPAVAVLLLWVTLAVSYYGSPLPHSMVAKSSFYQESLNVGLTASRLVETLQTFSGLRAPTSLASRFLAWGARTVWLGASALYCMGLIVLARNKRIALLGFCSYYLFQSLFYWLGGGLIDSNWYAIPPSLAFVVAALVALDFITAGTAQALRLTANLAVAVLVLAMMVLSHLVMSPLESELTQEFHGRLKSTAQAIGADAPVRFRSRVAPSVAVGDIGYIGYALPSFRVFDLWGLATPSVLTYKRSPSYLVPFLRDHAPDYVVLSERAYANNTPLLAGYRGPLFGSTSDRDWFGSSYELIYTSPKLSFRRYAGTQYLVFALRRTA